MLEDRYTPKQLSHLERGKWQLKKKRRFKASPGYNNGPKASLWRGQRPPKTRDLRALHSFTHDALYDD